MVVVLSAEAEADLADLRRTGRDALADRALRFAEQLADRPQDHRREGVQRSIEGYGGQGWTRTLRVGADVCMVGWAIDDDELVILRVKHLERARSLVRRVEAANLG